MGAKRAEAEDPERLRPALQPRLNEWIPHRPTPKQALFLSPIVNEILEVLFGGAAGGGKSDAVLMGALQYADTPGYAGLILRETYKQLSQPGGLMERSHQWLDRTSAHWNGLDAEWRFPSGARVTFGHLEHRDAHLNYGGGEYQYIAIDELTAIPEGQYEYLMTRLRRLRESEVPVRIRGASNPWGPGKAWVKARFLTNGPEHGRVFIQSLLSDNPHVDQVTYRHVLSLQRYEMRQALLHGDWDVAAEGTKFHRAWFPIWKAGNLPPIIGRVRWWDLAATEEPKKQAARKIEDPDYTAGVLVGKDRPGRIFVIDVVRGRWSDAQTELMIRATSDRDREVYGAFPIWMEQEPGASGKALVGHYRRNILAGFDFHSKPSTGSKEVRANPVAARAEHGEVILLEGEWNEDFLDELVEFPDGPHDDQVDALSGGYQVLVGKATTPGKPQGQPRASAWRV